LPVLAVGSEVFIGKEVKNQMEKIAEKVEYQELKFGYQLAEECLDDLAKTYLTFLRVLNWRDMEFYDTNEKMCSHLKCYFEMNWP